MVLPSLKPCHTSSHTFVANRNSNPSACTVQHGPMHDAQYNIQPGTMQLGTMSRCAHPHTFVANCSSKPSTDVVRCSGASAALLISTCTGMRRSSSRLAKASTDLGDRVAKDAKRIPPKLEFVTDAAETRLYTERSLQKAYHAAT